MTEAVVYVCMLLFGQQRFQGPLGHPCEGKKAVFKPRVGEDFVLHHGTGGAGSGLPVERAIKECDKEKAPGDGKQSVCSGAFSFFLLATLKLKMFELEVTILDTQNLHPHLSSFPRAELQGNNFKCPEPSPDSFPSSSSPPRPLLCQQQVLC